MVGPLIVLTLALGLVTPAVAERGEVGYSTILALQSDERRERRGAMRALITAGDRSLVPGLVDAVFFTPSTRRDEIVATLRALTGADPGPRYYDWVEWLGARSEIEPRPGYGEFKVALLARIDERYRQVLYPGAPARIRLEEVVWGGVKLGGIPALVNPATIAASVAGYLDEDELVFGAWVSGAARAYPLRIMDWHELVNDELGGEPVALSYCTLCRSGVLFHTRTADGGAHVFGTSGLLYRSNKLMIDQRTLSLWSNLKGEPVVGRLARSPVRLPVLPMTLTRWGDWRGRHPETTTLDLEALRQRFEFDYTPGAADRARAGVSFPVWLRDDRLPPETEVYALRIAGSAKVYPVDAVLTAGIVNDAVGATAVVLVADPESGAIRSYRRGGRSFRRTSEGRLLDDRGRSWSAEEEALVASDGHEPDSRLERQPGHIALWFGWYGFFPETEIWGD